MANSVIAVSQWIERLSALHRSLMRKFAAEEGLQLVHIEILQYLSVSNRYSNTTQVISEYLGQTKGSISQSLSHLQEYGFIKRTQDNNDKRVFHLSITTKGLSVAERLLDSINLDGPEDLEPALKVMLATIQRKNGLRSFGTCLSCKYNQNPGKNLFVCGLTKEKLSTNDVKKICKEHEPATSTSI
ncbi:MAG: MarR family transcriptional regulator [Bdellovibrio sp. CG10_big_fil_rev_8_21_14_0_10_47_8]|nr:MAG: MarR family transcriptional regulator [Bdellovibrio sp. CG10_big_fil_rev_8_21_14_0_10_47_8]